MPIIIALFLRKIVMASITGAGITILQSSVDGGFKSLVYEIRDKEGVTEQDAWDIVRNITSDFLLNTAGSLVALQTKLPVKTAELLGLTSKGVAKKVLKGKAAQVATKLASSGGASIVKSALPSWIKIAGIPASAIWLISAVANIVEPGIYKPEQTNSVYKALGIPFQYPVQSASDKPGPFSSDSSVTFADYYKSLEANGVKGINNTFALQTQLFTKQNLSDLTNAVYGKAVTEGKALSVKQLIEAVAPYLIGGNGNNGNISNIKITSPSNNSNNNYSAVAPANAKQNTGSTTQQIKVFTGVVSQGALGQGLSFQERQDDLIENIDELKQASSNNLAPFLVSLPSRVRYEIKVVSSITTKDGFTQKGTAQQVKVGTYQNGNPKYKTVVNKFAVMDLFILTDRGTRTKLTTIVLGPTNAITFSPGINDLNSLAQELPKLVTTQNTNDVSNIITNNDNVVSETPTPTAPVYGNVEDEKNDTGFRFYAQSVNGEVYYEILPWLGNIPYGYTPITKQEYLDKELLLSSQNPTRWKAYFEDARKRNPTVFTSGISGYIIKDGVPYYMGNGSLNDTVNSVTSASSVSVKTGANALTLSEWYQSKGQALPSVSTRSVEYERLGLGSKNYYTGTSEQNTKLLNALKLS